MKNEKDDVIIDKRMLTLIERALLDAGVSPQYVNSIVISKKEVECMPVFMRGYREYAVSVANQPNHILALFRSVKVMRAFIRHYGLTVAYDGVFG